MFCAPALIFREIEEALMRSSILFLLAFVVMGFVAAAIPPYPPPAIEAAVTYVADGDTIEVLIRSVPGPAPAGLRPGTTVRVRYIGVDAPEVTEANGADATELNAALVEGKVVYLELDETSYDPHGRLLAYVYLDPHGYLMVNLMLVTTEIVKARYDPDTPRYNALFRYFDAVPAPVLPGKRVCIPWAEAIDHVGEVACVEGIVASVGTSRYGDVFINLGTPYPKEPRFTVFVPSRYVGRFEAQFGARFWRGLVGKAISAYGEIELYKGIPEIELSDPTHLTIED